MSFGDDTLDPSNFWDGKERRSGGPMAVMADVLHDKGDAVAQSLFEKGLVHHVPNLGAVIRLAAENAAMKIMASGMSRMAACAADEIERHIRRKLGL